MLVHGRSLYTVYCTYKYPTKSELSFPVSSPDKPGRIRCILAGWEELCFAAKGEAVFLENLAPSTGKWHRIPAQAPKPGLWKQTHFLCLNRVPASLAPSSPCASTASAGTAATRGHTPSCNTVPGKLKEEHSKNQAGNNLSISGVRLWGIQ